MSGSVNPSRANGHTQDHKKNSQKNPHNSGRTKLTASRAKRKYPASKCCKDQLMTPKAKYGNCKMRNRNLNAAFIHHQKAFGTVPHSTV